MERKEEKKTTTKQNNLVFVYCGVWNIVKNACSYILISHT